MNTVGFIGTGGMGSHMARNLMNAGFDLVVSDLRPEAKRDGDPVLFSALTHEMFTIAQANGVDHYEATGVAWEACALLAGRDKFPPTEVSP